MKGQALGGHGTLIAELSGVTGCSDYGKRGCGEESASCFFSCQHLNCGGFMGVMSEVGQMDVVWLRHEA
jgi:hypothetical protein